MRAVLLIIVVIFTALLSGCAAEDSPQPQPAPKLSRRDARRLATQQRRAERRAQAVVQAAATEAGASTTQASAGSPVAGVRQPAKSGRAGEVRPADPQADPAHDAMDARGQSPETSFMRVQELEQLYQDAEASLWDTKADVRAAPTAIEELLTHAQAVVSEYEPAAQQAEKSKSRSATPAALVCSAATHYGHAAEALARSQGSPDGMWVVKAREHHAAAVRDAERLARLVSD